MVGWGTVIIATAWAPREKTLGHRVCFGVSWEYEWPGCGVLSVNIPGDMMTFPSLSIDLREGKSCPLSPLYDMEEGHMGVRGRPGLILNPQGREENTSYRTQP